MKLRDGVLAGAAFAALLAARAQGADELTTLLNDLSHAGDPKERLELVGKLATEPVARAADRLRDLVRSDPDVKVRVAAASALGASPVPECTKLLLDLVLDGGTHDVRRTIGRSIAKRGAREQLVGLLDRLKADPLGRGLVIAALGEDPSLSAAEDLERFARSDDMLLRSEALRVLAQHPIGMKMVPPLLVDVLGRYHDLDTVLGGIDVGETLAEADLRPLVEMLSTFLEPEVQGAIEAAKRRLAWLEAKAAQQKAQKLAEEQAKREGHDYAPDSGGIGVDAGDPPPPRPRVDIVYVYDATGSVCAHLAIIKKRMRREAETLARIGADFRVGLVAYRDTQLRAQTFVTRDLPLTYDLARVDAFIDSIGAAGADAQGACVKEGLEQGLDRMGWRWSSRRQIGLIADSKTGDGKRCADLVQLHFRADHTRLNVWYLYRTRAVLPPDIERLATVSGGVVESLE